MMLLPTLIGGIFSDLPIPDSITNILYPGAIKMKINNPKAPIIMVMGFLKMKMPAGKINSSTNNRQTKADFLKSLKGYLKEPEMMSEKFKKSPNKYVRIL